MSETCLNPDECQAVKVQVEAMSKVELRLEENNRSQEQTNLALARVTGVIETQNKVFEMYRTETVKDIDALFRLGRKNEIDIAHVEGKIGIDIAKQFGFMRAEIATSIGTINKEKAEEVGAINTAAAKKLGIWDIGKIIAIVSGILTIIFMAAKIYG